MAMPNEERNVSLPRVLMGGRGEDGTQDPEVLQEEDGSQQNG